MSSEAERFRRLQDEYDEHVALMERAERELRDDADELQAQEGWDREARDGVREWLEDRDNVWRALRRNRYDTHKAHAFLLTALASRLSLELHLPIPLVSCAESDLFYILPLPRFTDRLGRPIAVLSLRQVARDENGLEGLEEWMWWALEMTRRTLRDWREGGWSRGVKGVGGEGAVLIVDASDAGYRNMEVELLPTLFQVGHNNYPGLFHSVHIVNAGWSQRAMWNGVVKRVLPRSALDKVAFVQTHADLEAVFDPGRLPRHLGGDDSWAFATERNTVLAFYSSRPAGAVMAAEVDRPGPATAVPSAREPDRRCSGSLHRPQSCASLADIWFSARNSPAASRALTRQHSMASVPAHAHAQAHAQAHRSRPVSRSASYAHSMHGLSILGLGRMRMTAARRDAATGAADGVGRTLDAVNERLAHGQTAGPVVRVTAGGTASSTPRSERETPLKRIKSLSNFHLYLSPSRLANRDLLSDSDDDDDEARGGEASRPQTLAAPVASEPLATRRVRPALRIHTGEGGPAAHGADRATAGRAISSYASGLQAHHARGLEMYSHGHGSETQPTPAHLVVTPRSRTTVEVGTCEPGIEPLSDGHDGVSPDETADHLHAAASAGPATFGRAPAQPIPLYSASNPWFGYPAELVRSPRGVSVRPRYARNRKRDLIKTLIFLFTLRLQAWRDALERALGLWPAHACADAVPPTNPAEALVGRGKGAGRGWDRDWVWMVLGALVLRGTWMRIISAPLAWFGLEPVRMVMGV
ncbi:hypothetical protein Q5752_002051 [Cryptotrichosporon argae]